MRKIIIIVFIDEYNTIKHLFPSGTNISEESQPGDIAEAIFNDYEEQAKILLANGFLSFMEIMSDQEEWNPFICMCLGITFPSTWEIHTKNTG